MLSLSQQERAGVPQTPQGGLETQEWSRRSAGGPRGDLSRPSLPGAAGNAAGAAERARAGCERQRCKAPPGGAPRPRPYLWPTSLPTEPPPRAGSSGLSPCGSSGAEAPAGAPPGPALLSDGERGSLARAILRERTAAAAAAAAGAERALPSPRAAPCAPRAAAAVERPRGAGKLGGGRAPSRRGPGWGGGQARPPPQRGGPVRPGRRTWVGGGPEAGGAALQRK